LFRFFGFEAKQPILDAKRKGNGTKRENAKRNVAKRNTAKKAKRGGTVINEIEESLIF
jgi:hypothetical protein